MKVNSKFPLTALRQLASRYGIPTEPQDMFGRRPIPSPTSLVETLRALGAPIHRLDDILGALREHEISSWQSGIEPGAVAWDGQLGEVHIRLEAAQAAGSA